jgi:hypothetical protein
LFYTGSAGGLAWSTLMFVATLAVCYVLAVRSSSVRPADLSSVCRNAAICFGYVLCYCLSMAFFRVVFLKKLPTVHLPVIALLLGIAATLLPYLAAFFLMQQRFWSSDANWYLLGSPAVLTTEKTGAAAMATPVVLVWLALSAAASVPWWFGQWRRFRPLDEL